MHDDSENLKLYQPQNQNIDLIERKPNTANSQDGRDAILLVAKAT